MNTVRENVIVYLAVGRLPVSSSNVEVIRAVRKALGGGRASGWSITPKATRKAAYRTALVLHEENRSL